MRQKSLFLAGPSDPLGVPLHALADSLPSHRFLVQQQGNSLVAHHDGCVTTVRVASPGPRPIDAPNIRSVVHVVTQLPEVIAGEALKPSHATASMLNSLASLGSVHVADGKLVLSSRFACLHCDPDEALRVNGALLLARMLHAPRSVLRGFEYRLRNRAPLMRFSNWIEEDFEELAEALEGLATCTVTREIGAFTPPAAAIASRMRSPRGLSGRRWLPFTSPTIVTDDVLLRTVRTSTCAWLALPFRRLATSFSTSAGRSPRASTRPAKGTLIVPSSAMICSGNDMPREVDAPRRGSTTAPAKSMAGGASQTVTSTTSPGLRR